MPSSQLFLRELDKKLWTAADRLRSNLDAAVYKHAVLGLIFLKYVSDSFAQPQAEIEEQIRDPDSDPHLSPADYGTFAKYDEAIAAELEERDYYIEKNVFWVPALARWKTLQDSAKLPAGTEILVKGAQASCLSLPNEKATDGKDTGKMPVLRYKITSTGKLIDDALEAVEKENPKLKNVLVASVYDRRTLKYRIARRQPQNSRADRRRTNPRKTSDGRRPTLQLQIDPAMAGALERGGVVIGVMADSLERAALAKDNREALREGRLVLISSYDPAAGFNVGHAMQRNKSIYALADVGLVVTSDFEKGGTWAGAIEQLEKLHYVPVFVRNGANCGKGNAALIQHGGRPWPEPNSPQELSAAIANVMRDESMQDRQDQLGLRVCEDTPVYPRVAEPVKAEELLTEPKSSASPSERLMDAVMAILGEVLSEAKSVDEVVEILHVSKTQAQVWLGELVKCGLIEKLSKPVRYRVVQGSDRLL